MSLAVTVTVTGLPEEIARLNKLGTKLRDFTSAMKTVGDLVVKYYAGQGYASQGGVYGDVWPELSPAYAKRKAKDYPGRGILEASGTMKRSFEADTSSNTALINNTAPYAKYHQSTEPRTIMPYRPIMKVNSDVKDIVRSVIQEDIQEKIGSL